MGPFVNACHVITTSHVQPAFLAFQPLVQAYLRLEVAEMRVSPKRHFLGKISRSPCVYVPVPRCLLQSRASICHVCLSCRPEHYSVSRRSSSGHFFGRLAGLRKPLIIRGVQYRVPYMLPRLFNLVLGVLYACRLRVVSANALGGAPAKALLSSQHTFQAA